MVIAIKADWVWDGTGGEAIRDGVVLVDGERIAGIGPATSLDMPSEAETIERPGEFLMPGLIDSHTHITIIPGLGNQIGQLMQPIERQAMRGGGQPASHARLLRDHGPRHG